MPLERGSRWALSPGPWQPLGAAEPTFPGVGSLGANVQATGGISVGAPVIDGLALKGAAGPFI